MEKTDATYSDYCKQFHSPTGKVENGWNQPSYPSSQSMLERYLIKKLRYETCWHDIENIFYALQHIELVAKSMRKERDYLMGDLNAFNQENQQPLENPQSTQGSLHEKAQETTSETQEV